MRVSQFLETPVDKTNRDADWGPAPNDTRHRVVVSSVYRAPFDIQLGTIITAMSAPPYNITTGVDSNGDRDINERPIENGVMIPPFSARGDRYFTIDLRTSRSFRLPGERRLEAAVGDVQSHQHQELRRLRRQHALDVLWPAALRAAAVSGPARRPPRLLTPPFTSVADRGVKTPARRDRVGDQSRVSVANRAFVVTINGTPALAVSLDDLRRAPHRVRVSVLSARPPETLRRLRTRRAGRF